MFFERNLSHILPLLFFYSGYALQAAFAGLGSRNSKSVAAALGCVLIVHVPIENLLLLHRSIQVEHKEIYLQQKGQIEARFGASIISFGYLLSDEQFKALIAFEGPNSPIIFEVYDPGDIYTKSNLEKLRRYSEFELIGKSPSLFEGFPPSTLQTYLSNTSLFFLRR